jgi:GNAT superfamily N-acetyltransferase
MVATKFAVIELNVLPEFRGQGLGKELLNRLLSDRPEAFATLATLPSSMARTMYERWGWYKVAEFTDEPPMDALALELRGPERDTADS